LGLRSLELEEWRAWSLKSGEFESMSLKSKQPIFFFLFFLFWFWFWWAPLPTFNKGQLPFFFFFFWLLLGHRGQVSTKGKLELPLFFLFLVFISFGHKWAPSPSLSRGGA